MTLAQVRKAVVNVLGLASMAVTSGYLHGQVLVWVEAGIAAVTAVLHYLTPNAPAPVQPDPSLASLVLSGVDQDAPVASASSVLSGTAAVGEIMRRSVGPNLPAHAGPPKKAAKKPAKKAVKKAAPRK